MRFLSWIFGKADEQKDDTRSLALPPGSSVPLLSQANGQPFGYLFSYPDEIKERILRTILESYDQGKPASGGKIGSMVVEKLAQSLPMGLASFSMTGLYQIVASPSVLAGLGKGALEVVRSSSGLLSLVRSTATGQFVSGIAFSPASMAPIVVPAVVWQVIHIIFAVRELSKINERLDVLQRGIEKLVRHNQARTFGQLAASVKALQQLIEQRSIIGRFTDDMRHRLTIATRDIDASLLELEFKLRDARARGEQLRLESSTHGAGAAIKMFELFMKENTDYIADARLHIMACQASLLGSHVWVYHDLEYAPDYVWRRHECVGDELKQLDSAVVQVQFHKTLKEDAERMYAEMGSIRRWWHADRIETMRELAGKEDAGIATMHADGGTSVQPSLLLWRDAHGELVSVAMDKSFQLVPQRPFSVEGQEPAPPSNPK